MSTENKPTSDLDTAASQERSFLSTARQRSPWDEAGVMLFALLALIAHGSEFEPIPRSNVIAHALNFVAQWIVIALPFLAGMLLGWVLVTFIPSKKYTLLIMWASIVLGGLFLWAITHGRMPHIPFVIVASTMSALCLGISSVASQKLKN